MNPRNPAMLSACKLYNEKIFTKLNGTSTINHSAENKWQKTNDSSISGSHPNQ